MVVSVLCRLILSSGWVKLLMLVPAQTYDLQISTRAGCLHHTLLESRKFVRSQLPPSGSHAQITGFSKQFVSEYVNLGKKAKSNCVWVYISYQKKSRGRSIEKWQKIHCRFLPEFYLYKPAKPGHALHTTSESCMKICVGTCVWICPCVQVYECVCTCVQA